MTFITKKVEDISCTVNTNFFCVLPDNLYDGSRSFTFKVEVVVEIRNSIKNQNTFVTEMQAIIDDEDSSDIVIVSENEEFKCHKAILRARSPVFRNMLVKGNNFLETATNTIKMKDTSDAAVGEMVKHIYP